MKYFAETKNGEIIEFYAIIYEEFISSHTMDMYANRHLGVIIGNSKYSIIVSPVSNKFEEHQDVNKKNFDTIESRDLKYIWGEENSDISSI